MNRSLLELKTDKMDIYYAARAIFAKDNCENDLNWDGYAAWKPVPGSDEVVTLDNTLNRDLMGFDQKNQEDWKHVVVINNYRTDFYTDLQYVLNKTSHLSWFNLFSLAVEPETDCRNVALQDFEFIGYDLLDESFGLSSLTNCDGFGSSYTPDDLNKFRLIRDFDKAYEVKKRLREDHADHGHEVTCVVAIWRHTTIGRKAAVH